MAKNESIDELVSEKAFKQIEKLIQNLAESKAEFAAVVMEVIKLNSLLGGAKGLKEYQNNVEKTAIAMERLKQTQLKTEAIELQISLKRKKAFDDYEKKLKKEVDAINRREVQAEKAHQKELARIEKENLSNDKAAKLNSKRITEQSRIYNQLSKTLDQNRKDAKDIGVVYGENSVQFQKAAKSVVELDTRLKAIDAKLGQKQRNVGNYASGWNGLGNSVAQITREFPAFTNSIQTGFMALSNNLPIFFDQIRQTQVEIKALRAQGQQVPGLFKQLTMSIFSWGTALSIGITLLTVYAKEIGGFIDALFHGKKALNLFAENQKALGDVIKESNKSAGAQISTLKILTATARDRSLSDQDRLKAVRELQKEFPKTYKSLSDEIILNGKDKAAIEATTLAIIAQARARAAKDKLEDIEGKKLDNAIQRQKILNAQKNQTARIDGDIKLTGSSQFNQGKIQKITVAEQKAFIDGRAKTALALVAKNDQILDSQSKFLADFVGLNNLTDTIINNDDKKAGDNALRDQLELNKVRIERAKNTAELILTDESKSFQDRLDALKVFTEKSKDLIAVDNQLQLSEEGISATKRNTIAIETQNKLTDLLLDGQAKEKSIREGAEKELARILKDGLDEATKAEEARILLVQEKGQDRLRLIEQQRSEALNALGEQYAQGLIKEKQYREQSYDIESAAAADRLQVQIDALKEEIKLEEEALKFGIGTNKALGVDVKKLADLEIEASNLKTKTAIENAEKEYEAKKELKEKEKELAYALFEIGEELVGAQFKREEERNANALDEVERREAKEKKLLETQILTQDEKAVKIAQIEAKAQADREAIEKRQRSLEVNKAKFEKAASIARIIALTAENVMKYGAITPLSILVAAIGAAQIAKVLATPIPKFEDGGEMKYTGLAEYGHGTELRIDPDGKYSLTKSTPEIGIVEKGTEFISNANLKRIFAKPDQTHYVGGQQIDINKLIEAQNNSSKRIEKALNSKAEHKTVITKGGIKYMYRNGNNETSYVNKNLN